MTVQCPVEKGDYILEQTVKLPDYIPPGELLVFRPSHQAQKTVFISPPIPCFFLIYFPILFLCAFSELFFLFNYRHSSTTRPNQNQRKRLHHRRRTTLMHQPGREFRELEDRFEGPMMVLIRYLRTLRRKHRYQCWVFGELISDGHACFARFFFIRQFLMHYMTRPIRWIVDQDCPIWVYNILDSVQKT